VGVLPWAVYHESEERQAMGTCRGLVVDDEPEVRAVVSLILEDEGGCHGSKSSHQRPRSDSVNRQSNW
jgi:hypothetical protein